MSRHTLAAVGVSAALLLGAAAAGAGTSSDAWLTTKAKIALLTTDGVSATAVNVDSVDGKITIHGKVGSADEKAKAEAAVRSIDGVKEIRNLLQVVPPSMKATVEATDDAIENSVEAVLDADTTLKDVKVASVNKGVVLLSGSTADLNGKLKAIEMTLGTPGVKRVATEIKTDQK